MSKTPPKGIRSPARQSNREFLTMLHDEMVANRKVTRELLAHLRDQRDVTREILELLRLIRLEASLGRKASEVGGAS
jgi:hypothetical protein